MSLLLALVGGAPAGVSATAQARTGARGAVDTLKAIPTVADARLGARGQDEATKAIQTTANATDGPRGADTTLKAIGATAQARAGLRGQDTATKAISTTVEALAAPRAADTATKAATSTVEARAGAGGQNTTAQPPAGVATSTSGSGGVRGEVTCLAQETPSESTGPGPGSGAHPGVSTGPSHWDYRHAQIAPDTDRAEPAVAPKIEPQPQEAETVGDLRRSAASILANLRKKPAQQNQEFLLILEARQIKIAADLSAEIEAEEALEVLLLLDEM